MNAIASAISSEISSNVSCRNRSDIRITIVGIGNPLRGDDGFGSKMIERLRGRLKATLFDCGTAPENYIFPILNSDPDAIILLDTIDFEKPPGTLGVFNLDAISKTSLSTHNISLHLIADLLKTGNKDAYILMVGIQPKNIGFGNEFSEEVKQGMSQLNDILESLFPA
jgi:hydrogenase 3 maturation protease